MPITYQPGNLSGVKGFKPPKQLTTPKPKFEAIQTVAPNFARLANWAELPGEDFYTSNKRPGFTGSTFMSAEQSGYQAFTRSPEAKMPRTPLTVNDPSAFLSKAPSGGFRFGSADISIVDPILSLHRVTGEFMGQDPSLVGPGGSAGDPFSYFAERNIDLANAPSRLLDYAFTVPVAWAQQLMGQQFKSNAPRESGGATMFPFEADPYYWENMRNFMGTGRAPTDDELRNLAMNTAREYTRYPEPLAETLFARFKEGRDTTVTALSSGNERIDYIAQKQLEAVLGIIHSGATGTVRLAGPIDVGLGPLKFQIGALELANDPIAAVNQFLGATGNVAQSLFTMAPVIGTPLAEVLMPVSQEAQDLWGKLNPDQRRSFLQNAGMTSMATDLWAFFPMLSGAGAVATLLKAGGAGPEFMTWAVASEKVSTSGLWASRAMMNVAKEAVYDLGRKAPWLYKGYEGTMHVMNRGMAMGVAAMGANWAAETFLPGYAESVGYQINRSRPFSDSTVAAAIDNIGYFSSATLGVATAARATAALPRSVARGAGILGQEENRVFSSFFGGSKFVNVSNKVYRTMDDAALPPNEFETPVKSTIESSLGHFAQQGALDDAIRLVDEPIEELAHLPVEQRVAMANDALQEVGQHLGGLKVRLAETLQTAHRARTTLGELTLTDAQRLIHNTFRKAARDIEDGMAERLNRTYSEAWWQRQFRRQGIAYSIKDPAKAYATWLVKEAERKGLKLDLAALRQEIGKSPDDWRRFANLQHAHEYHRVNAELLEAAAMSPAGIEAHPQDYHLMRNDHLFQDRIDLFRAAKDQMGTDAAVFSEDEVRTLAARLINGTQEGEEWWARNGRGYATPDKIDLQKFSDYLDDIYATANRRHPVNVTGEHADLPINSLARRLEQEGVFTVAYKPKENLVAHTPRPIPGSPQEFATRVSQTVPDFYVMDPPAGIRAALDEVADGMFHVTMDVDAVLAEGLRTRRELIQASGDTLMFHGTGVTWFAFDMERAGSRLLVGKGLYLTDAHRLAVSYADNAGNYRVVKEFRVPPDAKLWDTMAPLQDDFFRAVDADLAKGQDGRLWKAAGIARRESGDMLAEEDLLGPGSGLDGSWWDAIETLRNQPARDSYFDAIALHNGSVRVDYEQAFKDAINEVMFDAGYEGLTHTGGLATGGLGTHNVTVLFDPQVTLSRAKPVAVGGGGGYGDPGRQVSFVANSARAKVIEDRYRLAVRAARGEATFSEILAHFEDAYKAAGLGGDLAEKWWTAVDDALRISNPDEWKAIVDDVIQGTGAYAPRNRSEALATLEAWFTPGSPYRPAKFQSKHSLAELVILLDRNLERGNPLKKPLDDAFAYDPTGWARYSTELSQAPELLATVDPAKIGTLRVARRGEMPAPPDTTPRMTAAEAGDAASGWENVGSMSPDKAGNYLYRAQDPASLDDIIENGLRPDLYSDSPTASSLRWVNAGMSPWVPGYQDKNLLLRLRYGDRGVGHHLNPAFDAKGGSRWIDEVVPNDLIEVWGADGEWHNIGRMDRAPQDPTPHEALNQWQDRLWEGVMFDQIPITPRNDSVFSVMSGTMYDEGMRSGTFAPANAFDDTLAYTWDNFMDRQPWNSTFQSGPYILELDRSLTKTSPRNWDQLHTFEEAPKQAVKRVWFYDQNRGGYFLQFERGKGTLGEGQFYSYGKTPAELRASSNHLWVVDERAPAKWAGWRDTEPMPLDNAWEQPWSAPVEDASLAADAAATGPTYRHVSYVKTRTGEVIKAPWMDYPQNPGDIYLGNRSFLGHKFDSVFQGIRSWKMHDYQLAQATRKLSGTYGFTGGQVEAFKAKIDALARSEEGWSPFGKHARIRVTPYATTKFRSEQVQKIGEQIFGKEEVYNKVTGTWEVPDYARLLGDAYQQAWTLNLSSGLTSRIKQFDHMGIGPTATAFGDWFVPLLRYKASVVFRTSELVESKGFNALRGVEGSPEKRATFAEAGISPQNKLLGGEFGTEPMLESLFTSSQSRAEQLASQPGIHDMSDMAAGSATGPAAGYALWRRVDELFTKQGARDLLDDIKDPTPYKNGQAFDMQIQIIERDLPDLIKGIDPQAYKVLREELHVPDEYMARFIAEDRILYQQWQRGQIGFEELTAHANKFVPGKAADAFDRLLGPEDMARMKEIYATEDWAALEVLMRTASLSAQMESFGVHYFGAYRSAAERTINHPLLGIYPASWALKAAREWVRFMYDNRVFGGGDLRLGMFPAVAMRKLIDNVNIAVAQNTDTKWQDWLDNGPAANWLFLWNLMLPGDWSSLPLPFARPIRSIARAIASGQYENLSPTALAGDALFGPNYRGGMGVLRDINLTARGIGDLYQALAGDSIENQWQNLVNGLSLNGVKQQPPGYSDMVTTPYTFNP